MSMPAEQRADRHYLGKESANKKDVGVSEPVGVVATVQGPVARQGDRGAKDENAAPRLLPSYVRYTDLVAAGIVRNWPQLYNLIDDYGFPAGVMLSPNARAWDVEEVRAWLASRPTERKIVPPRRAKEEIAA